MIGKKTNSKVQPNGIILLITAFLLFPNTSHAHLVNTGLGSFYDGIVHLSMSPDDLLITLALALLAGLSGARAGRNVLFLLPTAWFLGGMVGVRMAQELSIPLLTTLPFLVTGIIIALNSILPVKVTVAITFSFGAIHGFFNGTAMSQIDGGLLALLGVSFTLFVIVALLSAYTISLKKQWARITVRVAGSWIAAIGMLMLGWAYKG